MIDKLYYMMGGVITLGALICFAFAYYSDHKESSERKRRSLYSIINRYPR
ncbi:MAG: hypothetical protein RBR02_07910 [Desulfuromonadaceae bacterium]|nr:hypothetical protein [Desulfuromonadaceae bacterium]